MLVYEIRYKAARIAIALLSVGCNQNQSLAPVCRSDIECDNYERCVLDACLAECEAPEFWCENGFECHEAARSPVSFDGYWRGFVCRDIVE